MVEERDGAEFRLLTSAGCSYLEVTNSADAVVSVSEVCGTQTLSFQDPCLAYKQEPPGSGHDDASDSGPPCVSEVAWAAVWGRADYDFVAHACASGAAVATGPEGEYVIVVPAETSPNEPAFLLADGRAVQGPAWSAPLDAPDLDACRAAASVAGTPPRPIEFRVEVTNAGRVASPFVSLSTDTGFLAMYDAQAFGGAGGLDEPVTMFSDTTELVIQGLGETQSRLESELVVPIADIIKRAVAGGCTSIVIELESATSGTASEGC